MMASEKKKILFVDDEPNFLSGIKRILRPYRNEWELSFADGVDEAVEKVQEEDFDTIISDVSMPVKTGLDLLEELRELGTFTTTPIIILTGNAEGDLKRRALDLGATDLLNKPVVKEDLVARLQSTLRLKSYQDLLQNQNEALAQANQDLDAFNYSVAHDLRTPLNLMKVFAGRLLESLDSPDSKEAEHHVGFVQDGLKQMDSIINGLLRISKIGRKPVEKCIVNQEKLVVEVLSELLESYPERRVETFVDDLPFVSADSTLLRQVYVNLISNALKFTSMEEVTRISVGSLEQEGKTIFYVADNGIGFDSIHADTIFGAFKRLDNADDFEGTGVGLAIVRRIVEGHGGRIWAEGEVGDGATLYFSLDRLLDFNLKKVNKEDMTL
jgi:two-component system, sensor histidine kinase and response regulator